MRRRHQQNESDDDEMPGLIKSSSDEESSDGEPAQQRRRGLVQSSDSSDDDEVPGLVDAPSAEQSSDDRVRSSDARLLGGKDEYPMIRSLLANGQTSSEPTAHAIPGTLVKMHSLQSRRDLNGKVGVVRGLGENGRVRVDVGQETISVQPANLGSGISQAAMQAEKETREREEALAKRLADERSMQLVKELQEQEAAERRRQEAEIKKREKEAAQAAMQAAKETREREEAERRRHLAEIKREKEAARQAAKQKREREAAERRHQEEQRRREEDERKRREANERREFMATWGEAVELLLKLPSRTAAAAAAVAIAGDRPEEGPQRMPWMEEMKARQYDFTRLHVEDEDADYDRVVEAQDDALAGVDAEDDSEDVAPAAGHQEDVEGGQREMAGHGTSLLPASLSENVGMVDKGIWLTEDVKKWYAHADARLSASFMERLERLATRNMGRKIQKRLKGSTVPIFEAYLDQTKTALRILWTEVVERASSNIFVWFVSKHKDVSRRMHQIDESFKRLNRLQVDAALTLQVPDMRSEASGLRWEKTKDASPLQGRELLQPDLADALTRTTKFTSGEWASFAIRDLRNDDWIRVGEAVYKPVAERLFLARDQGWEPPLRLTSQEHAVIQDRATVLLLGRSGTGKTICIANKMAWDREDYKEQGGLSQLFVARSGRICRMVGSLQGYSSGLEAAKGAGSSMQLCELDKVEKRVMKALGITIQADKHVDYARFKLEVFPAAVKASKLDALVVWTVMRTFIKGSLEAVTSGQPVEEEAFLEFGETRARLTPEQRREAYLSYTLVRSYYATHGLYDSCDKMLEIHNALRAGAVLPPDLVFYKVYVDEVQDLTNAELALLWRMSESGILFLAGDPAQSVVEGVDFRFKEVRRCFYELAGRRKTAVPAKPQTLHLNFRSHAGILELASHILEWLYHFFPGSCDKIETDEGLCRGPRPGFAFWSTEQLRALLSSSSLSGSALVLLTPDELRSSLSRDLGVGNEVTVLMLGIREAKGLDFAEVLIVDFFKNLDENHHRNWKSMLSSASTEPPDPELETHIKLLYTAVTRAQRRLNFIETRKSRAADAFFRTMEAAERLVRLGDDASLDSVKMSVDDWMARGVEFALQAGDARRSDGSSVEIRLEEELKWLERSIKAFRRAGRAGEAAVLKAEAQREEALLRADLLRPSAAASTPGQQEEQRKDSSPLFAPLSFLWRRAETPSQAQQQSAGMKSEQLVQRGVQAVAGCIRQRMLFEARDLVTEVIRYGEREAGPQSAFRERLVTELLLAPLDERMAA